MALILGPQPLPQVVLSRDIGINAVREAAAAGLVRVSHGAFVVPLTEANGWARDEHLARARVVAAAHRLTADAVFSHESAALVHGLWVLRVPDEVHVIQRRTPRRQTPGLRRHTAELGPEDVVEVHGLRVTSVERTIADCAKYLHPREALVVADSGMRLVVEPDRDDRLATTERTEIVRERLAIEVERGARRGRRQARAIVAVADPFSESPYETVIRWIALSRGLPPPVLQRRFDVRGRRYYTDLCWQLEVTVDGRTVRVLLICEYDGELKYLGEGVDAARVVLAEKQREDDLRTLPDSVVARFDRQDAYQVEDTFRRICAALPSTYVAGLRPVPELAGLAAPRRRTA